MNRLGSMRVLRAARSSPIFRRMFATRQARARLGFGGVAASAAFVAGAWAGGFAGEAKSASPSNAPEGASKYIHVRVDARLSHSLFHYPFLSLSTCECATE